MTPRRKLALTIAIGVAAGAAFIATAGAPAHAQYPACGGQNAMHTMPAGGSFACVGSRTVLGGIVVEGFLQVSSNGTGAVTVTLPGPTPVDLFVEHEVHYGQSGSGGVTFTSTIAAGLRSVTIPWQVNLAEFEPFGCFAQHDTKIGNGDRDTPGNRVRVLGPTVEWPDCVPEQPTTVPDTTPTTSPASSTPTVPSTVAPSTTPAPASSSPGEGTIPATGRGSAPLAGVALALVIPGFLLWAATRRRAES